MAATSCFITDVTCGLFTYRLQCSYQNVRLNFTFNIVVAAAAVI